MRRMLINATQQEERRLAIVDGQKLMDFETEIEGREQRKGNIYKAIVTRVEPSLEACFVDYGEDRHGFLPFKEISRNYFRDGVEVRSARIQDAIRDGDQLVVQVDKEERGNKGAALTTFISLAGRYLVVMPNNPRGGGVSRRIEGEEREELKETLDQLDYPKGMSLIARTAGIGRSAPELQWDLNYLLKLWNAIDGAAQQGQGAFLIYQESSLVIRAIRDYFTSDIGEILIDTDDIYEQARQFMAHVMPDNEQRVKRYRDDAPLFSRFQIEHQIETAFSRTVNLPSGGAIVIDHTEALVAIDVNSARSTKGGDIEDTATRTNLEAAEEIARQMRLRDLGGLIVVDFIDMEEPRNRRDVENRLREALRQDRARVQFNSISKFGLLELSRQRLRPALSEGSHVTCPRCNGTGHIRDTESSALQILRMVQEESIKEGTAAVHVQLPVEVSSFLLNEKRNEITKIELKQRVTVLLVPNKNLETPNYRLERLRHEDPRLDNLAASYKMIEDVEEDVSITRREKSKPKQEPIIKGILPEGPAPTAIPKTPVATPEAPAVQGGFMGWLKRVFGVAEEAAPTASTPLTAPVPAARNTRTHRADTVGDGQRERAAGGVSRTGRSRGDSNRFDSPRPEGRSNRDDRSGRNSQRPERGSNRSDIPVESAENQRLVRGVVAGTELSEHRNEGRSENRNDGRRPRVDRNEAAPPRDNFTSPTTVAPAFNAPAAQSLAVNLPANDSSVWTGPAGEDADLSLEAGAGGDRESGQRRRRRGLRTARGERPDARSSERSFSTVDELNAVQVEREPRMSQQPMAFIAQTEPPVEPVQNQIRNAEPELTFSAIELPARRRSRNRREREPKAENFGQTFAADEGSAVFATGGMPSVTALINANSTEAQAPVSHPTGSAVVTEPPAPPYQVTPLVADSAAPPVLSVPSRPQSYELPLQTLQEMAQTAGLMWIHSDPEKVRAAQLALAQQPQSVHIPREPRPTSDLDQGPLILVETRKDLSQVRLPFEQMVDSAMAET
jgi:ribonuclease E